MFDFLDGLQTTGTPVVDDAPPEPALDEPARPIVACEEPGCGMELEYSGKGRKPRFCDEHKRRTKAERPESGGTPARRSRGFAARLEAVESTLTAQQVEIGTMAGVILPCTGITLARRAERTSRALVAIAADNPRMLEILEATAAIMPKLELGRTCLEVGVALMVDTGRINPDGMLAAMTGISALWHELHDEQSALDQPNFQTGEPIQGSSPVWNQQVPPRFQPVG